MARLIDIEIERQRLRISFPYERELVNVVRALPDRWWDTRSKNWFVPVHHLSYVLQALEVYHFKLSATLRTYCEQNGHPLDGGKDVAGAEGPDGAISGATSRGAVPSGGGVFASQQPLPPDTFTVSRLNEAAREALRARFGEDIWLVGELQDWDKGVASSYRTMFFDLVERPFTGAREVARIKVVMFEEARDAIERTLAALPTPLRLRDGLAVRFRARVDLYPQNGRYQVIVNDIDPTYTTGELELNRERIYRLLQSQGISELNLGRDLPRCPLRVGLITSYESDAYNDFVHQLQLSGYGFAVTVVHAAVQGPHTERSVLRALHLFAERADKFDVVAIVRGGGSRSDLAYFDTEAIGRAVCLHPVKIVCGVGHQRDQCLLDHISHSTKTPTAAAELLVRQVQDFIVRAEECFEQVAARAQVAVAAASHRLMVASTRVERSASRRLGAERAALGQTTTRITDATSGRMLRARSRLELGSQRLTGHASRHLERGRREMQFARQRLSEQNLARHARRRSELLEALETQIARESRRRLRHADEQLEHAEQTLRLLDPKRVLERGFAIVRSGGKLIRSRDEVAAEQFLDITLADGTLAARALDGRTPTNMNDE